ncbi:MAG: hypothetical protein RL448_289 [Actinomycetota bacterium]
MMKFTVISGNPTHEEMEILQIVANQHKRIEQSPVVKRSNWAAPLMRSKMPQQLKFGAGRNV